MVYTIVVHMRAKPDCVEKLHAKLIEASSIYSRDKETVSWFVMQSVHDKQDFTIVERYENEGSQTYHLNNRMYLSKRTSGWCWSWLSLLPLLLTLPRYSLLEDIRSICYPASREGYGSKAFWRACGNWGWQVYRGCKRWGVQELSWIICRIPFQDWKIKFLFCLRYDRFR